jgi:CheY-like chemotaxis protein
MGVLSILVIDDDDVAAEGVVRSLRKLDAGLPIVIAEDGAVALSILRNQHPERSITRPYIVLLDLNMPRMNGFEFLQEVRADPRLKDTVIFVLTTSNSDIDRSRAYYENIAGYMVKSAVGPQFSKMVQLVQDYVNTVALP